jgi:hypothetical protein
MLLQDITHPVEADLNFYEGTENITLPNGVWTLPGRGHIRFSGAPTFFVDQGPAILHKHLRNVSVLDYFAIYWEPNMEVPQAAEISFHWCIDTYDAEMVNNILHMNKTSTRVPKLLGRSHEYMSFGTSDKDGEVYTIGSSSFSAIRTNMNESLSGKSVYLWADRFSGTSGTDMLVQATKEVSQMAAKGNKTLEIMGMEKAWWTAVNGMAKNVASSLTNT